MADNNQPQVIVVQAPAKQFSRGVAMVLSLLIPGLGQIYKGQLFNGLLWLVLTVVGYALFVVPGLVLHLLCIIGAGTGRQYR